MLYKLERPWIKKKKKPKKQPSSIVNYSFHLHQKGTEIQIKDFVDAVCWVFFVFWTLKVSPRDDNYEGLQWATTQPYKPENHPSHLSLRATVMTAGLRQSAIYLLVKSFPEKSSKLHFYLMTLWRFFFFRLPEQCQGPFPSMRLRNLAIFF